MVSERPLESSAADLKGGLATQLFATVNEQKIRYCIWKGSCRLAEGLQGRDDLDLLVHRADFEKVLAVLDSFAFKHAVSTTGLPTPGVFHFYGYDKFAQRFIHVHLYTRLLTGESLVLTHWFPLETMLLEHRHLKMGVFVPSRPAELAILMIRMIVKSGSLFELLRFGWRQQGRASQFKQLSQDSDPEDPCAQLQKHLPVIGVKLFEECWQALCTRSSAFQRFRLGRRLQNRVQTYARFTDAVRWMQYGRLVRGKLMRVVTGQQAKKKRPRGLVIAFVGADATGKSTLISDTHDWLSEVFVVRRAHAGKPPSHFLTFPLNCGLPLVRWMFPRHRHAQVTKAESLPSRQVTSVLPALRAVALAWDRNRLLRKVHRSAASGAIVLCDRYPSEVHGAMDSPRLQIVASPRTIKEHFLNRLACWERGLYQLNSPADVVVKLTVALATAHERNRRRRKSDKHSDEELEFRHQRSHLWKAPGTYTILVRTDRRVDETREAVRREVWRCI